MLPYLILTTLGRKAMQKYLIKTLKPPSKTFKTTKKNTPPLTKAHFQLQVSQWSELGMFPGSQKQEKPKERTIHNLKITLKALKQP